MAGTLILHNECEVPNNQEIIFFNELIKSHYFKKKKILNNFKILSPYGLEDDILKYDVKYLSNIYDRYIIKISHELNKIHGTKKSEKYWSIILGKWLRDFTYATFNRYQTIKKGFKEHKIEKIILIEDKKNFFPVIDGTAINYYSNDKLFDAILISNIFKNLNQSYNYKINYLTDKFVEKYHKTKYFEKKSFLHNLLSQFLNTFDFSKESDFLVISSYLKSIEEIKLNFHLNKKFQFFYYPKISYKILKINRQLREKLNFEDKSQDEFEKVLNKIIPIYLPLTVLENYLQIKNFVESKINWPKNPKIIFSSNSFADGGPAQFWIAEKSEYKSKYLLGQHGAGYLEYYDKNFRAELKPVDGFISWGNHIFSEKIKPTFNFTLTNKKKFKKKDKLLFVFKSSGNRIVPYDRFEYGRIIFNQSQNLITNLRNDIKKKLLLRLHSSYKKEIYFEFDEFLKQHDYLEIDKKTNFNKLISLSKLTIYNDYSTGFVYGLNMNLPSLIFLPLGLRFIHDENKKDFIKLIENKMVFTSIDELKTYLNQNWDNIEELWNSKSSKEARRLFIDKYSLPKPSDKIHKLSEFLKKMI